jgi:two-component system phosphate regulon sensor histidine kinase PhoR
LLVVWLAAAGLLGLLMGSVAWGLVIGCLLYIARTLWFVYRLDGVLRSRRKSAAYVTRGLWAELFARVEKLRGKSRQRKNRYVRLMREVRESTGALTDGGIILNADREIVWFNPAATKLLGLDRSRDIGQRIDNLVRHPDFVTYLGEPTQAAITLPSPIDSANTLWVRLIPYGLEQNLAIVRDVTHETHLERTRRDFVANASHELRSPLTVISGYLDALADDEELSEAWQVPIMEMQRQADRMTKILRDLIELTRIESDDKEPARDFIDVAGMLRTIIEDSEKMGERPTIRLEIETDAALLGKESELHSVFGNLISNAIRFTPVTGEVVVKWREDANGAVFQVVDNGIGIAAEQIPRLTERFYRVDPGRSRALGGTGLGLAIVKHALQRHEGTLRIDSEEGVGSTFSCYFPRNRVVTREGASKAV